MIAEVALSYRETKKKINCKVDKDVPSEMAVDPDLLRHVYVNLLTNAMRYTDDEGVVEVELKVDGEMLESSVSDNGIGIPSDEKDRIFDKFYRATNATKKVTDGSGLGLYLVKTIVESSGGKVWFETSAKGTKFTFTLPLTGMKARKGEVSLS